MNPASLSLTFAIDPDEPAGTLEAVLAIARRGGVTLACASFTASGRDARARLRLSSSEPDRLDLFLARLHHVVGVSQVLCDYPVSASFTTSDTRELASCLSG